MDKNNDALAEAYGLVLESKDGTVGKDMSGKSFEGADKNGKPAGDILANAKDVKKPVAGPSQGDDTVAQGKGKPLSKKVEGKKVEESKVPTTFDKLYASVLNEEEGMDDVAPAGDVEDSTFDEDTGDFPEGDLEPEGEFDAAAAFSEVAAAIQGIADKLSGGAMGGMEDEFGGEGEDFGAEGEGTEENFGEEAGEEVPFKESASIGKIPAPTTPKVAKKTSFNPKMTKNPKNNVGKSGAGKAGLPAAGKDRTGTLSKAPATKFGPKMSLTVGGSGPQAKGGNESFIK